MIRWRKFTSFASRRAKHPKRIRIISPFSASAIVTLAGELANLYWKWRHGKDILAGGISFFFLAGWIDEFAKHWATRHYERELRGLIGIPKRLRDYVSHALRHHIGAMQNLAREDFAECSYGEQLAIAETLSREATTRFWATATDLPSTFWVKSRSYWNNQAKIPAPTTDFKGMPARARLIIQSKEALREDCTSSATADGFKALVDWHSDNKWALKFLPVDEQKLRTLCINHACDDAPIPDFMIINSEFVYGRADNDVVNGRVRIKYLESEGATTYDTFSGYDRLFITLWDLGVTYDELLKGFNVNQPPEPVVTAASENGHTQTPLTTAEAN